MISEKGQTTIPKRIRERFGICPGEVIEWVEDGGRLWVRKTTARDRIAALRGILSDIGITTDEYLEASRGPAYDPKIDRPG